MAFVSEIFDELRDLLNDPTDTQVSFPTKKLYINHAIARMWPSVYMVKSSQIPLSAGVWEYALSASISDGHVLSVEVNSPTDNARWQRYDGYDLIPGDEDLVSRIRIYLNATDDQSLRIGFAQPVSQISAASYAAAQSETWVGPDRAMHVVVPYVMSRITLRKLDDRQDTLRYSTTEAMNGVTDQDIIAAAQMYMAEFELGLEQLARPLPPARD